jgi:hypothetical protein
VVARQFPTPISLTAVLAHGFWTGATTSQPARNA